MVADDHLLQSMRSMGATEADVAAVLAERGEGKAGEGGSTHPGVSDVDDLDEEGNYLLEPDNWESWLAFDAVSTQWAWASMGMAGGRRVGLNYAQVESGWRMAGLPRSQWPALLADLRLIEREVLRVDNELAKREAHKQASRRQ